MIVVEWRVRIYYNPSIDDIADLVEAFKKAGFKVETVREPEVSDIVVEGPFGQIKGRSMVAIVLNQLSAMNRTEKSGNKPAFLL